MHTPENDTSQTCQVTELKMHTPKITENNTLENAKKSKKMKELKTHDI